MAGKVFVEKLKGLRMAKFKTQQNFADELKIPLTTYNQYELGRSEPDFDMIIKISNLLEVSIDELLTGVENNKEKYYVLDCIKSILQKFPRTKMVEKDDRVEICTYDGTIVIEKEFCWNVLRDAEIKRRDFVMKQIENEVIKQRNELFDRSTKADYVLEAKVLCETLGYDMKSISEFILENETIDTSCYGKDGDDIPHRMLDFIYYMYFMGASTKDDLSDVNDKINLINKGYVDSMDLWFESEEHTSSEMDAYYIKKRGWDEKYKKTYEELNEFCPLEMNKIAEIYLLQHFGIDEGLAKGFEMGFCGLRRLFVSYGLNNLEIFAWVPDEANEPIFFENI